MPPASRRIVNGRSPVVATSVDRHGAGRDNSASPPYPARYAPTRVKVEPRATLEQAVEIRRVLEKMGEKMARMAE
jgi:hypothetical protein